MVKRWFRAVPDNEVRGALELGLAVKLSPMQGFSPRLSYSHDVRLRADTVQVGVARSIALTRLGAFLELNVVLWPLIVALVAGLWCWRAARRVDRSRPEEN